ncbi:MAG: signal peptidase I [Spirochaetes bacterium GWC1_61_12]|nr:MAG: signal peptidase I [Spirochaetes bacterium GWC1_61_12]OHD61743.1 MAG: signal peptidase I [Spirochaetes bacterium GWF1_60_12]
MKRVESYEVLRKRQKLIWQMASLAVILFLFFELTSSYLLKSYVIRTDGMIPAIAVNSYILVSPSAYGFKLPFSNRINTFHNLPARGDVVLMDNPSATDLNPLAHMVNRFIRFFTLQKSGISKSIDDLNRPLVKRIVAIAGDTIKIEDNVVYIRQAGSIHFLTEHEIVNQIYDTLRTGRPVGWRNEMPFSGYLDEMTLQENEFFVMNDNRIHSNDSRYFGVITSDEIQGKVVFKYWPLTKPFLL